MDKITINTPMNKPYISCIKRAEIMELQLHKYDNISKKGIKVLIDIRAVPELIDALTKLTTYDKEYLEKMHKYIDKVETIS